MRGTRTMNTNLRWKPMVAAGAAALVFTFGAVTLAPQIGLAQDDQPAQTQQQKQGQQQQPGQWQKGDATAIDREALLADALGVTTDTLQTAYATALNAALDQAVEQDLLTKPRLTPYANASRPATAPTSAGVASALPVDLGRFGAAKCHRLRGAAGRRPGQDPRATAGSPGRGPVCCHRPGSRGRCADPGAG